MKKSHELSYVGPRAVGSIVMTAADCANYADLRDIGINLSPQMVGKMMAGVAMDDTTGLITTASIGTPIQFLQAWLPGFVRTLTQARKIDELIGVSVVGKWEDEEIVQGILEPLGKAVPYGDYTNIPLSSYNTEWARRTVLRFEQGFKVGVLEEARASRIKVSVAAEKRGAAATSLDIERNRIGFYGYNGGTNRTYGFLNDPTLPAYIAAAAGVGGTTWALKTFLEITADIRAMVARLRTATGDNIDPKKTPITLALASAVIDYLSVTSVYGNSVQQWITETYPKMRVESAPELTAANGGANVAYMYPERIEDGASDDSRVWLQAVPSRFQPLGVEKGAKGYVEDFTNATAGVMVKRPYAIQRLTGI